MKLTWGDRLVDVDRLDRVTIEDIAAALAQINRWGGRMRVPYNVARHSIDVARLAKVAGEPRWIQYECLMHDVTEAIVGDVPSPLKALLPKYQALEQRVRLQLAARFELDPTAPAEVEHYDHASRVHERAYLTGPAPREEHWRESRDRFLAWYIRLAPAGVPR